MNKQVPPGGAGHREVRRRGAPVFGERLSSGSLSGTCTRVSFCSRTGGGEKMEVGGQLLKGVNPGVLIHLLLN